MSTKRLEHLKEWEKIYFSIERKLNNQDDEISLCFQSELWEQYWFNNNDTFYTLEDLKQLANNGMPKQGDNIKEFYESLEKAYNAGHAWQWEKNEREYALSKKVHRECWDLWYTDFAPYFKKEYPDIDYPKQKTELTLAEVEEKLGLDAWSLLIKN